jgi:hypothetical protein
LADVRRQQFMVPEVRLLPSTPANEEEPRGDDRSSFSSGVVVY